MSETNRESNIKRDQVRDHYSKIATGSEGCCGSAATSPCCGTTPLDAQEIAQQLGYSLEQLKALPDGANLGLGCGNPTAIDTIQLGETIVDLGSGAGVDVFIAAKLVGENGKVIGVDMTDAMLEKARENTAKGGFTNVEFRKGHIEKLPIDDQSVDGIISNCVVNLSPEKDRVFAEAYRVLRSGGRMMLSDIVLEEALPAAIEKNVNAYVGCIGGASLRQDYLAAIKGAGFSQIDILSESSFGSTVSPEDPMVVEAMKDLNCDYDGVKKALSGATSLAILARK